MKLAFISDVHLGDPTCCLYHLENGRIKQGSRFEKFMDSVGRNNKYLVLMGDILDFAISKPYDVYRMGQEFFQNIKDNDIADEIIYIPGNHDFNFWNTYQEQIKVIHQIDEGRLPKHYRWALPGFIMDEDGKSDGLKIPSVSIRKGEGEYRYGGLFLENITKPLTNFNIVYPNLYVIDKNTTTLITHGHYFEMFWSIGNDWFPGIFGSDLNNGEPLSMKGLVGVNFPFCQLSSSGLGLAGPLTNIIGHLEHEIKEKNYKKLKCYLDNFRIEYLNTRDYEFDSVIGKFLTGVVLWLAESWLLKEIKKIKIARNNKTFFEDEDVARRFWDYFSKCQDELKNANIGNKTINTMIMGHTHVPSPWGSKKAPEMIRAGNTVPIYNTGGWLKTDGQFVGAEIFHYETGKGFSSTNIE